MGTKTSVGSGLWSAAGTWDTGVPTDNDVVVIAAGHVVEFDVDQSGFANGIDGITINGTLKLTRTSGTYCLKIKGAKTIAGAGTFDCGTSGDVIPFAAKHTITGGANWYINGASGLTMTVYAAEPSIKTIRLTGSEAVGQTVLEVDTNVIADIWAAGDSIRVDDVNKEKDTEVLTIAAGGIAAGAITVNAPGVAVAKTTGAVVHLITRNVQFIMVGTTANMISTFASGKLTIAGGSFLGTATACLKSCVSPSISGGVFSGWTYVLYSCTGATITGGVMTGGTYAFQYSTGTVSGLMESGHGNCFMACTSITVLSGTFTGNISVFRDCNGCTVLGGTFTGNSYGIYACVGMMIFGGSFTLELDHLANSSAMIKNASFSTSQSGDIISSSFTAFNTSFGSAIENANYTNLAKESYSESIDHDQIPGKFAAWTKGGAIASVANPVPTGYTSANQITLADANNEGFWQKEYTVGPGASVKITMNLYKSGSMAYLPRCIIFNKASADPFAGGAGIHTFTMTDSITTWESETYTYYNSTANDVTLVIRFQGKNASGTVTTALLVEQINVDLTTLINNLATVDTVVDAIKARTDNLPSDPADESLLEAAIAAIPTAPTAVQNRQEMDANSTRLSAIDAKTTNLPSDPADESLIEAAIAAIPSAPSTDDIMDTIVEGTYSLREVLRIMAGVLAGKLSGGGTGTLSFRDLSDSLDRVVADVDLATGDRDAITLDVS